MRELDYIHHNYNVVLKQKAELQTEIAKVKEMNRLLARDVKDLEMELRILNNKTAGVYGFKSKKRDTGKSKSIYFQAEDY